MNSLKKILGVGALTLALAGANCRNDVAYVPEVERVRNVEVVDDGVDINREYSFQDFKRVLGERYDPKKENELNEFWESYSNEDRELILGVFDYSGGVDGYAKKFEKFLRYVGCEFDRRRGSHLIYKRSGLKRPIVIPADTSLPVFIILNNLRVFGIDRETYIEILSKL